MYLSIFLKVNIMLLKYRCRDFPCGPVDKNQPTNTGNMGSMPGPGRPHVPWDNSACVPTACALQQEKPLQWDAQLLQLESSPR